MSECVPLCRPTWVQGVIPVTGALSLIPDYRVTEYSGFLCTRWILLTGFCFTTVFPKFKKPPGLRNSCPFLSRFLQFDMSILLPTGL